jgi:hypothetical protein
LLIKSQKSKKPAKKFAGKVSTTTTTTTTTTTATTMSYLAEVSANLDNEVYDYHLPHTKTIDLIGEEFAPRKHNVIVEGIGSTTVSSNLSGATTSSGEPSRKSFLL